MQTSIKILVIEDDLSLCEVLRLIFKSENYDFQVHENAGNIFELVANFKPDIVLLDYLLPMENGGEICSQLKKNADTATIPVIIYSALCKQLLQIEEYHCDCFIEKPFELNMLLHQIEKHASSKYKKTFKPLGSPEKLSLNKNPVFGYRA